MPTITEKIKILTEENNVSVCYDTELSRILFDDWKEDLEGDDALFMRGSAHSGTNFIVIGDMSKRQFKKTTLVRMKKDDLVDLHEHYFKQMIDAEEWTKDDLIDDLLTVDRQHHYHTLYEETHWHDLDCDFIVTGYIQGDAVKILILDDEWKWNTEEYLSNLLFDTPINGIITFKGEEYHVDDYLDSQYEFWDKEKFILKITSKYRGDDKEEFEEFLKHSLPKELDYV